MSTEAVQTEQRKLNLEAITRLGFAAYPHKFDTTHTVTQLVDANTAKTGAELEGAKIETVTAGRVVGIRSFGKASFLVLSDGRSRLPVIEAARRRRSGWRDRAPVPHQDQRAVDLGVEAGVPRQVLPAAAGKMAWPAGRRDSVPPAVSRSDRQPGRAPCLRNPHAGDRGDSH